ncbi:MAG: hypothetical protein E7404_06645 [Ruminococcaceae bacterium]|nr:hypothetical protein [Oscillospiraceae bacterium]
MLLWDYEKEGYYTYKLIANDDACEECAKLNGKEFLIKDFDENEFFPVVHPNCKCEILITDENSNVVSSVNDKSNETENVSVLDKISNFLAVASLIPGFDTFTDLVSIPVDLLRGDFLSAGLDVLGVVPFIGEVADTAKIINKADDAIDAVKAVNKADKATDTFNVSRKTSNIINKQKRGTPRNNKAQNKQTGSIAKKLKLTPKQQRELHDLIHGQNWGYQEILDFAKSWFNK